MADLCLTLTSSRMERLEEDIRRYVGPAPLIEVRLDSLDQPRLPDLPESSTQFIATCRPEREGGHFKGDERARLELLAQAGRKGFTWVDIEHDVQEVPPLGPGVRLIRSLHDFDACPPSLDRTLARLKGGGDLLKLAVTISTTRELVRLLGWMESLPADLQRIIIGMGPLGTPSRSLGAFLGNRWTYVFPQDGSAAAPGQFSLEEAHRTYGLDRFRQPPELYGLIGNPVAHSLSPLLHNSLFRDHGRSALYLPYQLDDAATWLDYVDGSALPFAGFSVTIPFKTQAARHRWAKASGLDSVNTLTQTPAGWKALNTDFDGFLSPLARRQAFPIESALVMGSGGAARSAIRALMSYGADVICVSREADRSRRLAAEIGCRATTYDSLPASVELCVNATPVGQWPQTDATPLDPSKIKNLRWVYDLIYRPARTRLLELAEDDGIETISGLEMFAEQAALQFSSWTGIEPDRQAIAEILEDFAGSSRRNSPQAEKNT